MIADTLFQRKALAETPGFNDTFIIYKGNHLHAAGPCATGPNHRQPTNKGGGHWNLSYGLLSVGQYEYECIIHPKYGKCLIIEGGGICPSEVPNPSHDDLFYMTEIFVHKSVDDVWRGSAGCPTIPPKWWPAFISCYNIGQLGVLEIAPFRP